jgi:hypothetical protein
MDTRRHPEAETLAAFPSAPYLQAPEPADKSVQVEDRFLVDREVVGVWDFAAAL